MLKEKERVGKGKCKGERIRDGGRHSLSLQLTGHTGEWKCDGP